MKKSQVLAALALAFALGVVVPVAGTYAQITPNTATEKQKTAIYDKADAALDAVADLDNFRSYAELYSGIEGDNGLVAALDKITSSELRWFNENLTVSQSVNGYIKTAGTYTRATISGTTNPGLYAQSNGKYTYIKPNVSFKDAELKALTQFTKANTLADAYSAVTAMQKAVEDNITILKSNYIYNGATDDASNSVVAAAIQNYDAIKTHLNDEIARINQAYQNGTPYDFDAKGWGTAVINANTTPANFAQLIKNIDSKVYDALTKNADWNKTENGNGIARATDFGLAIKAAKNLPKYNFVKAVADAEANVEKIQESNPVNVDYEQAKAYIATLDNAVKAYKDGKTDGTGDGTNKPDDEKDPSAPDTGILSNTEASASTTLAMVAGIATALTAAGAGVVAYRNARRSARK